MGPVTLLLTVSLCAAMRHRPVRVVRARVPTPFAVASVGPSQADWNPKVKEAWSRAYASAPPAPASYEIEEIEGLIPRTLRGSIFRNGPGNFERGGNRFKHVLDGDGLLCRFSIDGSAGRAHFQRRFVETPAYKEEEAADAVLNRNTFGTQPAGGPLTNFGQLVLKNPANTHVARSV